MEGAKSDSGRSGRDGGGGSGSGCAHGCRVTAGVWAAEAASPEGRAGSLVNNQQLRCDQLKAATDI
jgi:hypothetical protein